MSTPGDSTQSESALNKPEESTNSATKADPIESNEEASVTNNAADVAKKELPSQSVSNGALAESEAKVVANGLETTMNGQEEKSSDGPPRPIPDLLPLAASPTPVPQPTSNAANSTPPKQSVNSQPITLNTTASPVVATKSAPPPPSSPTKTRGRNLSPSIASSSPSKETANASATGKATEGKEEQLGDEKKETKKRKPVAKKRDSVASSDSTEKGDGDSGDGDAGRKSKRARTRTQPYQSSDMDANLLKIIKQSAQTNAAVAAQQAKLNEEKLVVFFKGEFLAVRNAEGGFYICQAMQNINRGSHKIRIRWLSQAAKEEPKGKRRGKTVETAEPAKDETGFDIYTPDFYDNTDFECILTNLELEKFGKDRYGLPEEERTRTENILRRALEVEQGKVDNLELTEEHPDGLDVSLFHDESQLKRKRRKKAKQTTDDDDNDDDSSSASSSESESDSEEAVATTSGHSRRVSKPAEPEPKTSTSGVASTSSGRGTKRTRAAAARQKIQMRYHDEDTSDDDDDDDDDIEEDDVSSSDSDGGKRRRGRTSTRRARNAPVAKARAKSAPAARSARGKKLVTPKRGPIPIIKKGPAKTPAKQVATETASKRRKVAEVQNVKEDKDESPTSEKVVTVDVEMSANEASDDSKPKAEREETTKEPAETAEKPVEKAKEEETKEAQDTKEIEPTKTEETKVAESTEEAEVTPKDNETTAKDAKSEESPKDEVKPSSDESPAKTEPDAAAEAKETTAASEEK